MATDTKELDQDVESIKKDIKQLRQDMASLTADFKKVMQGGAEAGRERAQDELESLYDQFKETYGSLLREGGRAKTGLEKEIGDRPFTILLGAFIVGIFLGKSMSTS
jgi:ElaB/YqjD/DUF883 family membrane-anchored ribosome-binding protein